jgi:protein-tyrosine kinase
MSRIEDALDKISRMQERSQRPAPEKPRVERVTAKTCPVVPKNPCIVTLTEPDSPAAEEYRKMKTTILRFALKHVKRHSLMISSCVSGEGKSLTAINLAISMAQEIDHGVLLIDADLRRPSIAEYLGIPAVPGLAECLRNEVPAASAIIKTDIPGLSLLPGGKGVKNPVEMLSSPMMRSLFGDLMRSATERSIIIDTPPVLPFAETQTIGSLVDGILLVVKEGTITMPELLEALDIVDRTKVLGVIYNDVTDAGRNNRYSHYYRYYAARRQHQV